MILLKIFLGAVTILLIVGIFYLIGLTANFILKHLNRNPEYFEQYKLPNLLQGLIVVAMIGGGLTLCALIGNLLQHILLESFR